MKNNFLLNWEFSHVPAVNSGSLLCDSSVNMVLHTFCLPKVYQNLWYALSLPPFSFSIFMSEFLIPSLAFWTEIVPRALTILFRSGDIVVHPKDKLCFQLCFTTHWSAQLYHHPLQKPHLTLKLTSEIWVKITDWGINNGASLKAWYGFIIG